MTDERIFEEGAPQAARQETFAVTVDGEQLLLTMEQLLEAAQAGLNKRNGAIRTEQAAAQLERGGEYAAFLAEYPTVAPADIPPEVWEDAAREGSLVAAYRAHELRTLRAQLAALTKNRENAAQEIGAAGGDGEGPESDPIIRALGV